MTETESTGIPPAESLYTTYTPTVTGDNLAVVPDEPSEDDE